MAEDGLPVLEHGRYRLWQTPDGGWLLARAAFTCDRCQSCGCGDQQDHVNIPGMLVRMAEAMQADGGGHNPLAMMRRLMGHGRRAGSADAESGGSAGGDLAGAAGPGPAGQEGSGQPGDGSQGSAGEV